MLLELHEWAEPQKQASEPEHCLWQVDVGCRAEAQAGAGSWGVGRELVVERGPRCAPLLWLCNRFAPLCIGFPRKKKRKKKQSCVNHWCLCLAMYWKGEKTLLGEQKHFLHSQSREERGEGQVRKKEICGLGWMKHWLVLVEEGEVIHLITTWHIFKTKNLSDGNKRKVWFKKEKCPKHVSVFLICFSLVGRMCEVVSRLLYSSA